MANIEGNSDSPDYLENSINPNEDDYIDGKGGGQGNLNLDNEDLVWWENKNVARGHGGNDILVGNLGSYDVLIGGLGTDTFSLNTSNTISVYLEGLNGSHPFVWDVVNQNIHWIPDYVSGEDSFGSGNTTGSGDNLSFTNASPAAPINAIVFDANGNPQAYEITSSLPFFFGIENDIVYNPALSLFQMGYFDNSPYLDLINLGNFNTNPIVETINANIISNNPLIFGS